MARLPQRGGRQHTLGVARLPRPHGRFLAGEVGELAGVPGTTIGQWARWGYIRSSQSDGEPRVYSVEDINEAAVVSELLGRGVAHADVRRAIEHLATHGPWPLSQAPLGTIADGRRSRIVLDDRDGIYELSARGWRHRDLPVGGRCRRP